MLASLRRIAGLFCYAFASLVLCVFVASAINRTFWHSGADVGEDMVVFGVMGILTIAAAAAGHWLKPGRFSMQTLLVGLTVLVIVMGELAYLARH
jgi:hypothetical protein